MKTFSHPKIQLTSLLLLLTFFSCKQKQLVSTLQVPGYNKYCTLNVQGESVIPNGRIIRPHGELIRITPDPFGMALSPDGSLALAVHNDALSVISTKEMVNKKVNSPYLKKGSYMGVAIGKENKIAYLSGGDHGDIILFNLEKNEPILHISVNGVVGKETYNDSFVGDIRLSADEKRLYILDQFNFRMVILDLVTRTVTGSVKVGRFPLGIDLSPDGQYAYVANTGIYDYPLVPGLNETNLETVGIDFPPYGIPSAAAENGLTLNGQNIPGLGSPQVPDAVSVWTIHLTNNQVIAREKTGFRMGEMVAGIEVVGGSSPNSIAAGKNKVFVTNATNDNVSVLDPHTGKVISTIQLRIDPKIDAMRGLIPFGIELSHDESTLYVALSGLNCVAVVDVNKNSVLGYIPTGWFPTKLQISPDDKTLYVVTARGFGSGRNAGAGFDPTLAGTYVGDIMTGTFEKISLSDIDLQQTTQRVKDNTFAEVKVAENVTNPLPAQSGSRQSPIRHIVYITKENRTFDEIFGELKHAKGDPSLARYGKDAMVVNKDKTMVVNHVNVMPNHQKIAADFAVSDNFYTDSDASVHGHRWMVGTYPNEWVEINSSVKITENVLSTAPGRKMVAGASGAVFPEDYNEAGGMWEHLARHGVKYFNFGLGFEFSGSSEEQWHKYSGIKMGVMFPMPKTLFDNTSRKYATFNTSIPDQFRIDMFEEELKEKWLSGKEEFPAVVTMMIPNDHGSKERPNDGYPFKESYMADNDLALGRVLHTLSRTKWWKDMLVIVTEDDAQDGRDHVDAHRSILMMISPWVKKNYVSHTHANFGAIIKTIYQINNLPALNQFDATASLLQDFFTDKPDFRPFTVQMIDQRIFDPQKALDPYKVNFNWESLKESPDLDDDNDFRESHKEQMKGKK